MASETLPLDSGTALICFDGVLQDKAQAAAAADISAMTSNSSKSRGREDARLTSRAMDSLFPRPTRFAATADTDTSERKPG